MEMIAFTCETCNHSYKVGQKYAERKVRCSSCGSVCLVPKASPALQFFYKDIHYASDGITPDFDDIFRALLKQEREAPAITV